MPARPGLAGLQLEHVKVDPLTKGLLHVGVFKQGQLSKPQALLHRPPLGDAVLPLIFSAKVLNEFQRGVHGLLTLVHGVAGQIVELALPLGLVCGPGHQGHLELPGKRMDGFVVRIRQVVVPQHGVHVPAGVHRLDHVGLVRQHGRQLLLDHIGQPGQLLAGGALGLIKNGIQILVEPFAAPAKHHRREVIVGGRQARRKFECDRRLDALAPQELGLIRQFLPRRRGLGDAFVFEELGVVLERGDVGIVREAIHLPVIGHVLKRVADNLRRIERARPGQVVFQRHYPPGPRELWEPVAAVVQHVQRGLAAEPVDHRLVVLRPRDVVELNRNRAVVGALELVDVVLDGIDAVAPDGEVEVYHLGPGQHGARQRQHPRPAECGIGGAGTGQLEKLPPGPFLSGPAGVVRFVTHRSRLRSSVCASLP